jgi:hypothetical protein
MLIERSSGVTLREDTISDSRPGTMAAVEIGPEVAPGENGVSLTGLNASLAPGVPAVNDRRAAPAR